MKKIKLGDLLLEQAIIQRADLDQALSRQQKTGQKLGDLLIEMNLITEENLLSFLAGQLHLPFINLETYRIKQDIARRLPEVLARRYKMIPIDMVRGSYLVATSDPTDIQGIDQVNQKLDKPVRFVVSKSQEIIHLLNKVYNEDDDIRASVNALAAEYTGSSQYNYKQINADTPIAHLLFSIIRQGHISRASDIHLEPGLDMFRIRYRVDGILNEQALSEKSIYAALVLRVKLMAGLDISEHRLPQDGRFSMRLDASEIDIRVSTMPMHDQESVVMRLLDKTTGILNPDELGMTDLQLAMFKRHIHYPHGMILVCGPTGSGKSTTIYSALAAINTPEKKIITVEDPVEYTLERVNQIQIQPKIGLDFAAILRSSLRHDPDVIMVGEIRDEETAAIALKAAMTGHLVLSTLHTYDAVNAPIRLLEMGMAPYVVASSLKLILSQRLLRCLCSYCKKAIKPTDEALSWIQRIAPKDFAYDHFYQSVGCERCDMKGYKGRVGVYEILEINEDIAYALRKGDLNLYMHSILSQSGYESIDLQSLYYARDGITSLDQAMRVGFEAETVYREQHERISLPRA